MRWFWIDRFTEFISGERAVAVKSVCLSEDHVIDYPPGFPTMPASLIIEGLAQTAGLLVGEHYQFQERVVLAKIGSAKFHEVARAGDILTYTATIEDIRRDGAGVICTSHLDGRLQAEVNMMFAHLDDDQGGDLFHPAEFQSTLRAMRLYEVGRTRDGRPLQVPEHLRLAELQTSLDD